MRNLIFFCGCFLLVVVGGTAAEAVARVTADDSQVKRPSIDLSGEWEFKLDPLDVGRAEKWFEERVPYDRTIRVPGAWNAQGVTFASEEQLRNYEQKRLDEQKSLNRLGILGVQRESDRLFHTYPGPGWYRKKVTIPAEWKGKVAWLVFGGVHREADIWVNGTLATAHQSYLTPFRIDLSPYAKAGEVITISARVDARRRPEIDPLMGCLDTLDFLYVTWGGIHRAVALEATERTRLEDVFVVPKLAKETAEIHVIIQKSTREPFAIAAEILDASGASVASAEPVAARDGPETVLAVKIANVKLWSPKTPHLYTARVRLLSGASAIDARSVRFGMREFTAANGKFLLNGHPIFLRGYGDDCIFPNSICPPSDKTEFRRRLSLAREYGFNYVRHHSWTPPEEYLEAADELGMMLQPEFPFAYRWDLPSTPEAKRAALDQWEALIRLNRSHPSIVVWCMGNEQYDSFDLAPEMYRTAKHLDPSRLVIDSDGCNFKHKDRETLDFLVVQFGEAHSIGHGDGKYNFPATITKPVIAHEMGYFVTLHDLAQIDLFHDGLRPYWLFQTRDLAERNGLLNAYPEWLAASYRLQALCLKTNMEAARRSRLAGTSVWLFQDYPNCAEGVVDMFGRPKGLLAAQFRKFNAPTVLLLDAPRRNWWSGEIAELKFVISRFEDEPADAATLRWQLLSGNDTFAEGVQEKLSIRADGVQEIPAIKLKLPEQTRAVRLTLKAELTDVNGKTENAWDLWVFPKDLQTSPAVRSIGFDAIREIYPNITAEAAPPDPSGGLIITTRLDRAIIDHLATGGRVFLLEPEPAFAVEKTNFRLSSWDGGGPSGTIFDAKHPALRAMPSEGWCDLQFYSLLEGSKTIFLNRLPEKIRPLVRCIDRPTRLSDRAYLFEASVGKGKLLVSGFNFAQAIATKDAAGIFLFDQLVRYALSGDFAPEASIPSATLKDGAKQ